MVKDLPAVQQKDINW